MAETWVGRRWRIEFGFIDTNKEEQAGLLSQTLRCGSGSGSCSHGKRLSAPEIFRALNPNKGATAQQSYQMALASLNPTLGR